MKEIGEKLKTSREESGLSLEEVSGDIKIDIKSLENIEQGNKMAFTDNYELKKNIYDYAKYLGLNYEELIEEFNEFMFTYTSKIPVEVIERISKQKEKEEQEKGALSPYTAEIKKDNKKNVIIIIILLMALIATISTIIVVQNNRVRNNPAIAALF